MALHKSSPLRKRGKLQTKTHQKSGSSKDWKHERVTNHEQDLCPLFPVWSSHCIQPIKASWKEIEREKHQSAGAFPPHQVCICATAGHLAKTAEFLF